VNCIHHIPEKEKKKEGEMMMMMKAWISEEGMGRAKVC